MLVACFGRQILGYIHRQKGVPLASLSFSDIMSTPDRYTLCLTVILPALMEKRMEQRRADRAQAPLQSHSQQSHQHQACCMSRTADVPITWLFDADLASSPASAPHDLRPKP